MSAKTSTGHFIVLDEGQAQYLTSLSRVCVDYRSSWEALAKRGEDEKNRLAKGQWVSGPSHQIMSEVEQEYGKIKMALDLIWSVFRVDIFDKEDQEAARNEISEFIKIATAEPKSNASFSGTWFQVGSTLEKFSK